MAEYVRQLRSSYDRRMMEQLLEDAGLQVPESIAVSYGYFADEEMLGCCSRVGDIVEGVAIAPEARGMNIAPKLVSAVVKEAASSGMMTLYLFTKPDNERIFRSIGFRTITDARPYSVLMEFGLPAFDAWICRLKEAAAGKKGIGSVIVMNANPFTLGHRHLVATAAERDDYVFVMVVEEEGSEFSFADRFEMVRKGTEDLKNVTVIPSGRYTVSGLTFPSYFTKAENFAKAQATVDAELFAGRIAPALGVQRRYVGTEPISAVTAVYNETMKEVFGRSGLELVELERIRNCAGDIISASEVRRALMNGDLERARMFLPVTTLEQIQTIEMRSNG